MPFYALIARDVDGARRERARPAHIEHLDRLDEAGRLRHAGPLLNDAGEAVGSLIILEADSLAEAKATFARDPYLVDDVFGICEVLETKAVFPRQA